MKRLFLNILLFYFSVLFILLIGEASIRIIGIVNDIDFRVYIEELENSDRLPENIFLPQHLGLKPNSQALATTSDFSVIYNINSDGLRDKEYFYEKPLDKIRILALGNSYTFGEGVKYGERFTDIAEDYSPKIEILNFGVPGYGLDNELIDFMTKGLKYSPDYAIIFLNKIDTERYSSNIIVNDSIVLNNISLNMPESSSSTIFLRRDEIYTNNEKSIILRSSYFLSYISYQIKLITLKKRLEIYDKDLWADILKESINNKKELDYDYIKNRTILIIEKFNEICREKDIQLIIVNIDRKNNLDYLNKINSEISYYSLTDKLKNKRKKYSLSFKYDHHYNKKTHNFIGKELIKIIQEKIINQ